MLDMSVRAKILELMLHLKAELDLTYLYITHDLATAKFFCDRVAIMYLGKIVEIGPTAAIFSDPKHPYTVSLMKAIPDPDPDRTIPRDLPRGEVPDAVSPPLGCSFHPRCPRAFDICGWESRDLKDLIEARWTKMPEEDYERERELVGNLESMEVASPRATVPTAKGQRPEAVLSLLQRMRDEDPAEPLWRGVADMSLESDHVRVEFNEPEDPHLGPTGDVDVDVACHLYTGPDAADR
jgi:peptide/nickel transport system ATP-binding protein